MAGPHPRPPRTHLAWAWLALVAAVPIQSCTEGDLETGRAAGHPNGQDDGTPRSPDGAAVGDAAVDAQPLRVVVISDLNGSYGSTTYETNVHAAITRIVALQPDLVLSTGDMVAGQKTGLDYGAMWAAFHAAVSDPLAAAGIPFAVTPGNHDASAYGGFEGERSVFFSQWSSRRPDVDFVDDAAYPFQYAFRMGGVLFVSLDDTKIGPLGAGQMTWLQQLLSQHGDAAARIVFGHVPLYPFVVEKVDEVIGDGALETLLLEGGVDAFISGHHHAYYPGKRGVLRLVGMACLGQGARTLLGDDGVSPHAFAVFDFDGSGIAAVEAYAEPDFTVPVLRETLPPWVGTGDTAIVRDDL